MITMLNALNSARPRDERGSCRWRERAQVPEAMQAARMSLEWRSRWLRARS